ncbi:hypothetical protein KKE34_03140, partial [Patescibacteria group bacterium]|nr:hypothetical protein [Patescibacteria group bacterium]
MNLTKILIRLLLLTSVVGGGIYVAKQKTAVKDSDFVQDFEEKKEELQGSVRGVTDGISSQTEQLTNRGQEISKHISNILGAYIQSEPNQSSSSQDGSSSQDDSSSQ